MKKLLPILITGALVLVLVMVLRRTFTKNQLYSVDVSRTAVVKQLQALNRYETTSFTIEKIIEADTNEGNAFREFLFGDKILLIANGEVIGGFDLSSLSDEDIKIDGKHITVNLPAPQILVTRLDSEKTRVYDRRQGLLAQGDKDLETQARVAAEQSIREAACQSGVLNEASTNGRTQLETILKTVGFETVVVNIPDGSC